MSGVPTSNEIVTTRHIRDFLQFGGARPSNLPNYYGADAQYMIVDSESIPETGAVNPVYVPDPRDTSGRYRLVAKTINAPGSLPKMTLTLLEKHGSVPRQLARFGQFTNYENVGFCKDPSDFLAGWSDYVQIISQAITETRTPGKRGDWKTDTEVQDKIAATAETIYSIGALQIGEKYTNTYELLDVVYGSLLRDGSCGPADDGTKTLYGIVKHGVGSATSVYSLDGGATWTTLAITGIGATADPNKIRVMGQYLVILVSSEHAHYYTTIDQTTGIPASTWTKVTTGYGASAGPTDMFVSSSREAYLCGLTGYLYKMTDPTAGVTVLDAGVATVQNLNAIHGQDNILVAVGAATAIVVSTNRGVSWAAPTTAPGAAALNTVCVVQPGLYWVGDAAGAVYYTQNGGATAWTQQTQITGYAAVKHINFATKEVGFIAGTTADPLGKIWSTWNGGQAWTNTSPRIQNQLKMLSASCVNTPQVAGSDPATASNNIAIAGLGDTGVTGAIAIGATAFL